MDGAVIRVYQLDRILLPEEDIQSKNPNDIVSSNRLFFRILTEENLHLHEELPRQSVWSAFVDTYFAEVYNGGHRQFIGNVGWSDSVNECIELGLRAMGASSYEHLFVEFRRYVNSHSVIDIRRMMTSDEIGVGPAMEAASSRLKYFDNRMFELGGDEGDLHVYNGNWLKSLGNVATCPYPSWRAEVQKLAELNPFIGERRKAREDAGERNRNRNDRLGRLAEVMCARLEIPYRYRGTFVSTFEWGFSPDEPVRVHWFANHGIGSIGLIETRGRAILIEKNRMSGEIKVLTEDDWDDGE